MSSRRPDGPGNNVAKVVSYDAATTSQVAVYQPPRGNTGDAVKDLEAKLAVDHFLLLDALIQLDDLLPHSLVLVHQREVEDGHPDQRSNDQQSHDYTGEFVPNSGIDLHLLGRRMPVHECDRQNLDSCPQQGQHKNYPFWRGKKRSRQIFALSNNDSRLSGTFSWAWVIGFNAVLR